MTGPSRPFDGRNGVFDQLSGPFEVRIQPERDGYKVTRSNIKGYPMAHMTHAVVSKLVEMTRGRNVDDIDPIEVRTHSSLIFESGGGTDKWDPQTRETA